ncbi:hypothetical protein [Streptomyces sp. NPDC002540]
MRSHPSPATDSTIQYIHLSGRDLADKLARGMEHIHAWRIQALTSPHVTSPEVAQ